MIVDPKDRDEKAFLLRIPKMKGGPEGRDEDRGLTILPPELQWARQTIDELV